MAANGITLKPVRMGDLVNSGTNSSATAVPHGGKYTPPSRRQNSEQSSEPRSAKVDMNEENFPTLGSTPKKAPVWGKNVAKVTEPKVTEPKVTEPNVTEPKVTGPSLSDKIKEKLRLDAIAEEERVRGGEMDVWKMTPAQLEAEGWVCLPLKSSKNVSYYL
jgi:hypothetical protein